MQAELLLLSVVLLCWSCVGVLVLLLWRCCSRLFRCAARSVKESLQQKVRTHAHTSTPTPTHTTHTHTQFPALVKEDWCFIIASPHPILPSFQGSSMSRVARQSSFSSMGSLGGSFAFSHTKLREYTQMQMHIHIDKL